MHTTVTDMAAAADMQQCIQVSLIAASADMRQCIVQLHIWHLQQTCSSAYNSHTYGSCSRHAAVNYVARYGGIDCSVPKVRLLGGTSASGCGLAKLAPYNDSLLSTSLLMVTRHFCMPNYLW